MEKVRTLLLEMKQDEYVRFKYGKAIDGAVKALDAHQGVDQRELEVRLLALLEMVRPNATKSKPRDSSKSNEISSKPKEIGSKPKDTGRAAP